MTDKVRVRDVSGDIYQERLRLQDCKSSVDVAVKAGFWAAVIQSLIEEELSTPEQDQCLLQHVETVKQHCLTQFRLESDARKPL